MTSSARWSQLQQGLAEALAGLEDRTFVTLSWSAVPTVYAQLEQTAERVVARTGADDVIGEHPWKQGQVRAALEGAGWHPPGGDASGQRTWTIVLPWPSRTADYERLAARCVAVFRDLHGVSSPAELEYRAWREAEPDPEDVPFYPDDLEAGEPHLVLPALGLRDAQEG